MTTKSKPTCGTCSYINDCREASDHAKELSTHKCSHWKEADLIELNARERLLQAFGPPALCGLLASSDPSAKRR